MHRFIVARSEAGKIIVNGGFTGVRRHRGVIVQLIGLQPQDVMLWVLGGEEPAVVRIVGQLGGYAPVVNSELEGSSCAK